MLSTNLLRAFLFDEKALLRNDAQSRNNKSKARHAYKPPAYILYARKLKKLATIQAPK
jgi:hypothetical protein